MWRPEGWKTPNIVALKEVKAGLVTADQVRYLTEQECKAYEAGADALLEALKKDGQFVNNDGLKPYGMVLARSLKRGEKGWLAFIPDKD
jgi:hypothetical protein